MLTPNTSVPVTAPYFLLLLSLLSLFTPLPFHSSPFSLLSRSYIYPAKLLCGNVMLEELV
jgi:hypothetical protein